MTFTNQNIGFISGLINYLPEDSFLFGCWLSIMLGCIVGRGICSSFPWTEVQQKNWYMKVLKVIVREKEC